MTPSISNGGWTRYVVTRKEVVKTTWAFKAALIVALVIVAYLTEPIWARAVAESLVCRQAGHLERADAILIDDFESDYQLFARARLFQEAGLSSTVIAPVNVFADGSVSTVSEAMVDVLAGLAQVKHVRTVPVGGVEPFSLNAAFHIKRFVEENGIKSVMVVSPAFRSERSMMIYRAVLEPAGVSAHCAPVFGRRTQDNWTETWHGIQDVALQFVKLQYYRWYVLPFRFDERVGVSH
jgi:hypothetical protein